MFAGRTNASGGPRVWDPWSSTTFVPRYIKVKVEHYLLFMFSPPKISWVVWGIKYICLHVFTVFYLIQPSSNQIICFEFGKQNSVLPTVFYVPWFVQEICFSDVDFICSMLLSEHLVGVQNFLSSLHLYFNYTVQTIKVGKHYCEYLFFVLLLVDNLKYEKPRPYI